MMSLSARMVVAAALLVPTAVVSGISLSREARTVTVIGASALPERIDAWESNEVKLTESELSMLDAPAASQRVYRNPLTGDLVQILLLQVNNTQNAHDPKLCMAGSGYAAGADQIVESPWASGKTQPISRTEFQKGDAHVTMYYWLQTADGTIANMSSGMKLEGIRRALLGSAVRGVAVRVIALPHSDDPARPTDPKVAEDLWSKIAQQIRVDGLVAKM